MEENLEVLQYLISFPYLILNVYWELNVRREGGSGSEGWVGEDRMTHRPRQEDRIYLNISVSSELWRGYNKEYKETWVSCERASEISVKLFTQTAFLFIFYRWNLSGGGCVIGQVSTGSISHPPPPINMSRQGGEVELYYKSVCCYAADVDCSGGLAGELWRTGFSTQNMLVSHSRTDQQQQRSGTQTFVRFHKQFREFR